MHTETPIDPDTLNSSDKMCTCDYCTGKLENRIQIVKRPEGEYIIIDGRLHTGYGAPIGGGWDADYHAHENIVPVLEQGTCIPAADLWPLQTGVFDAETTVDLWRTMKRGR